MFSKQTYYRLVALWVVCEAMLGGIIHGLKLPISGLIVGGAAVICICMIANYYPMRGVIIKATIIVAIFKMMLSPQSPMPAYIAVFFQGLLGELLFMNRRSYRINCILLGILSLAESALQRLLMMTIVYGMQIWKAINIFINGITGQENLTNYSYYIATGYVLLHLLAGFMIGFYAGIIPLRMNDTKNDSVKIIIPEIEKINIPSIQINKKRKWLLLLIWIFLSLLFIQSLIYPEHIILPQNIVIKLLLRSILIILTWIVFINPLLLKLLHGWLEKKKSESESDIKEILLLLPSTQFLIQKSWELSSERKNLKRISFFFKIVIYNSLNHG